MNDPSVEELRRVIHLSGLSNRPDSPLKLKATGARVLEIDCPQPFAWDADSGERMLEMFHIMAVVIQRALTGHVLRDLLDADVLSFQRAYLATKRFMPNLRKSSVPKIA